MLLRFGVVPVVVFSSKEAAKEVLKTHDLDTCTRPKLVANGLFSRNFKDIGFTQYGEDWREMKKLVGLELFSPKKHKSFRYIREEEGDLLVKKISNSAQTQTLIDLRKASFSFTAGTIFRLAFGQNFHQCDFMDMDRLEELVLEAETNGCILALTDFLPTGLGWLVDRISGCGFGGSECGNNHNDLQKVEYLNMVIKETFRLHPPSPLLLPRETMSDIEIQGYHIPKNALIRINTYTIGRDLKCWSNPERFLNTSINYKGQDYKLLPFGAGRRSCPGMNLGITILELGLLNILYFFDWSFPNGMTIEDIDMEENGALNKTLELIPTLPSALSDGSSGWR
ncbi:cytochrome P450, family 71, subfamily B, polypeptide 32 [Arabidopsis thaliana]|uniref:Cytochrome P450, family 71, subfamily B, polypeptide 32 n=1 Tax=Arabidopsis thaliana TaxID=3702 RepID=F4J9C1_ARATH|nr:cytochrome P450, family 71, subfamily B, polypeptide 32 [Arabidopsis thaliana]AEE79066.1 cytochrome P450, family 71, subfamily B, polypeptide 32 [Arabidopsis thaliana]|eukprot:NP_680127.1 cytochrome P450, family 71, subfamily B, polypeptide 32 [Arabidopsis thaliana]